MKKRVISLLFIFVTLFLIVVGPWPTDNSHYSNSKYAAETFQDINSLPVNSASGQLQVGLASINITPAIGIALGGYSNRDPKANTGVLHPVHAKAITLDNGIKKVTLLSAEILLPLPELIDAVLQKTGLSRDAIYFAVTHTHSGPGAYGSGLVEELALGDFNPQQFKSLVNHLSQVVLQSRENLQAVELEYQRLALTQSFAIEFVRNQLNKSGMPHNSLHLMQIKQAETEKILASLITFSAHPTFLGRRNKLVSGDYPGILMQELEKNLGHMVMFTIGAVGGMLPSGQDHSPKTRVESERQKLDDMGHRLANFLTGYMTGKLPNSQENLLDVKSWKTSSAIIQSDIVPIQLPYSNYRITDHLRLSPLLVTQIFHDNDSFIHALRIGKLVFLGYPADYSGELAKSLEEWAIPQGVFPWATSMSGEYLGYIMPSEHYDKDYYVMRGANFYGRWAGDYFNDASQRIVSRLYGLNNP